MLQKVKRSSLQDVKKRYTRKNEHINNRKEQKKNVRGIIAKGFIVGVLCIMSTYAWFTSQKDITISNLRGTVEVVESMEISLDAKAWYHRIDLSEIIDGKTALQNAVDSRNAVYGQSGATAPNIEPKELLPVSTVGGLGASYVPFYKGEASSKQTTTRLKKINRCVEIETGNVGKDNGYFAFDIYIKNTSRDNEPDILQLNLNSSAQVLTEDIEKEVTENGVTTLRKYVGQSFSGIQNTVRVALGLYEDTVDSISTQKEVLDATRNSTIEKMTIWEPNAPHHVGYVVDNNNKLIGSGGGTFANGDALTTYALTERATLEPAQIDNVFNTDDPNLGKQSTVQTEMTSTVEGAEDYKILAEDSLPINLLDTDGDEFTIQSNKISRLRVYVWIEGQDVDCINLASLGGGVEVDLGLTKDFAVGTVLEDEAEEEANKKNNNV